VNVGVEAVPQLVELLVADCRVDVSLRACLGGCEEEIVNVLREVVSDINGV